MTGKPWSKRELQAKMRKAGWKRIPGPATVYQSPDDDGVLFHFHNYEVGRGFAWEDYAINRKLPATKRAR